MSPCLPAVMTVASDGSALIVLKWMAAHGKGDGGASREAVVEPRLVPLDPLTLRPLHSPDSIAVPGLSYFDENYDHLVPAGHPALLCFHGTIRGEITGGADGGAGEGPEGCALHLIDIKSGCVVHSAWRGGPQIMFIRSWTCGEGGPAFLVVADGKGGRAEETMGGLFDLQSPLTCKALCEWVERAL